jgi:multidrug efflux pump subunit AcrA (membrane-fusion protein)
MKKFPRGILFIILTAVLLAIPIIIGYFIVKDRLAIKSSQPKILYYRNPMNPQITSPVPMRDSMGMDYVPVYSESQAPKSLGVYISPEKQQLMDIKTEKVENRDLVHKVLSAAIVAYDPQLYTAQEEYLQALKAREKIGLSTDNLLKEQVEGMVAAVEKKLILMGMNKQEIEELGRRGRPQANLYLPYAEDKIWIYANIYEADLAFIKEDQDVEIETLAFPAQILKGRISSISPVFDAMTRSVKARIEIDNPGQKLKPEMFADAKISVDLGRKLAVPEEAVIDTGVKQAVFVAKPGGYFEARQVTLGAKAGNYYEVISGLKEGEEVVSAGNFFVDSESRLKLTE